MDDWWRRLSQFSTPTQSAYAICPLSIVTKKQVFAMRCSNYWLGPRRIGTRPCRLYDDRPFCHMQCVSWLGFQLTCKVIEID